MASFRKRNGLWQVQVRSIHAGATSKSFHRKSDAERWAIQQEALMQTGQWAKNEPSDYSLKEMMKRYLAEVTPTKKGKDAEARRLKRLLSEKSLMSLRLDKAEPHIFAAFRDQRIKDGVRACQYDLVLFRHAWNIARIEWGWPLGDNPLTLIRMPKNNPPRERRLKAGEYERLEEAAKASRSWYLWPIIVIAIETGMRRGEILGLRWEHIDEDKQFVLLPITKNGSSRRVPLSDKAFEMLLSVKTTSDSPFPITDIAFRQAWDRLRQRAHIVNLTFHDLRHEAISRLFESGLKIHEVMAISGHKTASQLFRYVQIVI